MLKQSTHLILAIFLSFAVTACSKPSFSVQPLQVNDVVMSANSTDPSVPKEMQFTVEACMNNSASPDHNSVTGTAFELDRDGNSTVVQSDDKGCLFWPETLGYHYLDSEHYFKFSRTIKGRGNFGGSQTVEFAMDPWKNSSAGFVDLKITPIDDAHTDDKNSSQPSSANASFVHSVSVHTYNARTTESGTSVHAQLTFNPYSTHLGLAQNEIREPITTGHFKIELFLLELNKSEKSTETTLLAHDFETADAEDGVITLISDLHLTRVPKLDAQIALAFRLTFNVSGKDITQESLVMMDSMLEAESTFSVQPVTQSLDALNGKTDTGAKSADAGSLPATAPRTGAASAPSVDSAPIAHSDSGFRIDSVNITSGGVTSTFASTNIAKSVSARVSVCLRDSVSLAYVVDHEFQLGFASAKDSANVNLVSRTSDSSGCLFWQTEISFDGYASAQWYEKSLIIHSSRAPYLNTELKLSVNLNPSQTGSLYFWDSRNGAPPSVTHAAAATDANSANSSEASMLVKELSYSFTGRDFELDHSMNLVMNRHYQIRFLPMIAIKNSFTTEIEDRPLENGRVNIKLLLMSGDKPLSLYSGSIAVSGGEAVADVTLPFEISRFPEVMNHNELILEVSDADPASRLKSDTLSAPFIAMTASGSLGLQEGAQASIPKTIPLSHYQAVNAAAKKLSLISQTKLTEADLSNIGFTSTSEVQSFIGASGEINEQAGHFCELIFSNVEAVDACKAKPSEQLIFAAYQPNDGFLGMTSEVSTDIYNLTTSASMGWRTAQSAGLSQAYSNGSTITGGLSVTAAAKVSTGIEVFGNGADLEGGAGANAGMNHHWDWYTAQSVDRSQVKSRDFSISKMHALVVEEMKIQAMVDPGTCLSVASRADSATPSIYFCSSPQTGRKVTETWYFVHPVFSLGTMVDGNEVSAMNFTSLIRGTDNFAKFKSMFTNKNNFIVFDKNMNPPQAMKQVLMHKFHLDKVNKGVIDKVLGDDGVAQ
jgi:hypothetical protein